MAMADIYRKSKLLRRSRVFWASFSLWRPRLVFWCGALAIGVISVAFARLADLAQHGFNSLRTSTEWSFLLPLVLTPAGFALSAYLAIRFFPNAQGSGIPQAIAARHLKDDEDRGKLLSLRIAFGKILLTVLGLSAAPPSAARVQPYKWAHRSCWQSRALAAWRRRAA